MLAAPLRIGAFARIAFRPFTRDPLPADLIASWMKPERDHQAVVLRDDVREYAIFLEKRYE